MNSLARLWSGVLAFLGIGREVPAAQVKAAEFKNDYADTSGINLNYIAASKVANYVVAESTVNVSAKSLPPSAKADTPFPRKGKKGYISNGITIFIW